MAKFFYWAVRPISTRDTGANTRIERAETAQEACELAFGRGFRGAPVFEAKNLGSRVSVVQSHNKRVALLHDFADWVPVRGY
jgi:hypothetical protein